MSVLNENTIIGASAAGEYEIEQSLRFDDGRGTYLSRTFSVAGNRKTWTFSAWVKLGNQGTSRLLLGPYDNSTYGEISITSANAIQWNNRVGGTNKFLIPTQLLRDSSSWYHIICALDTTQGTEANRAKIYINGEQVTDFSTEQYPAQNNDVNMNGAIAHSIGRHWESGYESPLDGYLAEVNFIDGLALTPDSFGETGTYGEWKPIAYAGGYGTNGFYLDFKASGSLGNDAAGSNNWTIHNLAATDQMLDSPTNNFATLNPLDEGGTNTVAEGNLQYDKTGANFGPMRGTLGVTTGKWYFEAMRSSNTNICQVGVSNNYDISQNGGDNSMGSAGGIGAAWDSRGIYYRTGGSDLGKNTFATNEIVSIAFDADTGKIWWRKSGGSWQDSGNPETGANPSFTASGYSELMPFVNGEGGGGLVANFGQDSSFAGNKTPQGNQDANGIGDFYYAPPSGFLSLCTKSLPSVDVIPSENFNTVLWSGNGSATRSITGVGFEPSMLWAKSRTSASNHNLIDAVRGVDVRLLPASTSAEIDSAFFASLDSDGFSLDNANDNDVNQSGQTYVAWNWQAGGSASSNSNGTITSSVSANAAAGFSILTYTGTGAIAATIGHGLSSAPEMIIRKDRDAATNWSVFHASMGTGNGNLSLFLNTTSAQDGGQGFMNNTAPTSTVFTQGDQGFVGVNGRDYISYCFHSVDGYSKVGSYTGNGSADGPFVHCGFRPAFVMYKQADGAAANWEIIDNTRNDYNVANARLFPSLSNAESAGETPMDLLSNGFKTRATYNGSNSSGLTYIFLAFAESPFKFSNAR